MFRLKTNQFGSSESGSYTEATLPAPCAVVDDVTYDFNGVQASPIGWGDFEGASSIDNRTTDDWQVGFTTRPLPR